MMKTGSNPFVTPAILIAVVILFASDGYPQPGGGLEHVEVPKKIEPGNRQLSLVVTYPGEVADWSAENIEYTFATVARAGFRISQHYYAWGEIEQAQEHYNWKGMDYHIGQVMDRYPLKASLVVKIVDGGNLGQFPGDVGFISFRYPKLVERFRAFVLTVLDRYPGKIRYLWIGNEVDRYFMSHRNQITDFNALYRDICEAVRQKHPEVKVGTISTYHAAAKEHGLDIIRELGATGDLIGFTLYPQLMEVNRNFDVSVSFRRMDDIADSINRPYAITETGWSSDGPGGSEHLQARYIKHLVAAWNERQDRIAFLGLYILYDWPPSLTFAVSDHYGHGGNNEFMTFQGSLGLARNTGTPKQAWSELLRMLQK